MFYSFTKLHVYRPFDHRHAGIRSFEARTSGNSTDRVVAIENEFLGLRSLEACVCEAKHMYTTSAYSTVLCNLPVILGQCSPSELVLRLESNPFQFMI